MKSISSKFYALIFWRTPIGEILSKVNDIYLHLKYYFNNNKLVDKENLKFFLVKQYHIVEKGLALPSPRPGFGKPKIKLLIQKGTVYYTNYGDCQLLGSISTCLNDYIQFHENIDFELDPTIKNDIKKFTSIVKNTHSGGALTVFKSDIHLKSQQSFETFVRNRYSIRNFSEDSVNKTLIEQAISLAKYVPSVCNRQGWNAHLYSDKQTIKELLLIQNGNGGFTDCIDKVIIVTGNIKAFSKYESNQIFTDGGLFSLNLMYSLHYLGLGTCPLNTCFPYIIESKVKELGDIPHNERLIMMLAVGNLKDEFKVAISQRKPTSEILVEH